MKINKMILNSYFNKYSRTMAVAIIYICFIILILIGLVTLQNLYRQQEKTLKIGQSIEQLIEQNNELAEQNKVLSEDSIFLADRNIFYTKCVARSFAEFTRTRTAITIKRLEDCNFQIQGNGAFVQMFEPTLNNYRQTELKPSSSDEPDTEPTPPQPDKPNPLEGQPPKNIIERILDNIIKFVGGLLP